MGTTLAAFQKSAPCGAEQPHHPSTLNPNPERSHPCRCVGVLALWAVRVLHLADAPNDWILWGVDPLVDEGVHVHALIAPAGFGAAEWLGREAQHFLRESLPHRASMNQALLNC